MSILPPGTSAGQEKFPKAAEIVVSSVHLAVVEMKITSHILKIITKI